MIRRRRLKVPWFLAVLCLVVISGILLYENIEMVNEYNQRTSMEFNLPRKSLLSIKSTANISTLTEAYPQKISTSRLVKKHVTKSLKELGKMDPINRHFLFLNSVPKSGSEILIFLLEKIQGVNNFKHVRLGDGEEKQLTIIQQENLVNDIYDIRRSLAIPLSFDRNVYFINFTMFDKQWPTYINLIRDPVAKVMSRAITPKTGTYDSYFIRCLSDKKRKCNFKDGRPYDLTIPYFCGNDPRCMLLNDQWAFETAKENAEQYYQVIGVLEELNTTLDVLQDKIPQFFWGAKSIYHQNLLEIYKNKKEPVIPDTVREVLETTLTKEIEFYHWARERLLKQNKVIV